MASKFLLIARQDDLVLAWLFNAHPIVGERLIGVDLKHLSLMHPAFETLTIEYEEQLSTLEYDHFVTFVLERHVRLSIHVSRALLSAVINSLTCGALNHL